MKVFSFICFLMLGFVTTAWAGEAVPYLDSGLKLIGENKGIATVAGGWLMNLVWKMWPTANPSGIIHKLRDLLMAIKKKRLVDKIIDLCDLMLGIFDVVTTPVPNKVKK